MTRVLPLIHSKSVRSATKRDCHCPDCRRLRQQELEALIDGDLLFQEVPATITPVKLPTPGSFYSIQQDDKLLGVAGRAYSLPSGQRLEAARLINDHSYNMRFRDPKLTDSGQFPQGRISFNPKFTCDLYEQKRKMPASSGKCFATIWIPHRPMARPHWAMDGHTHSILWQAVAASATGFDIKENSSNSWQETCRKSSKCTAFTIEADTRKLVPNTKRVPYMYTGSIIAIYNVGSTLQFLGPATCFSVGKRHILTAAHVIKFFFAGKIMRPIAVLISFGRTGHAMPYGELFLDIQNQSDIIHIPQSWTRNLKSPTDFNSSSEYCLIRHRGAAGLFNKESTGLPLGFWGSPPAATSNLSTRIGEPADRLQNMTFPHQSLTLQAIPVTRNVNNGTVGDISHVLALR